MHEPPAENDYVQRLAERERQLQLILDAVPLIVVYSDRDGFIRYANRRLLEHFERELADVIGRHVSEVVPPRSYEMSLGAIDAVLAGHRSEIEFVGRNARSMRLQFIPDVDTDGRVCGYYTVGTDVTDERLSEARRVEQEQRLRAALVSEVHHRVKNMLQGVVGLLRATRVESAEARQIVDTVVAQVMTIAIGFGLAGAHGGAVDLAALATAIARYVEPLLGVRIDLHIAPEVRDGPLDLDESTGVNLGLVLNELLVNAWKHRPIGESGALVLELGQEAEAVRLTVLSPGARLAPGVDYAAGRGLGTGLSLVKALVPTRGATLDLVTAADGVRATLRLTAPLLRRSS